MACYLMASNHYWTNADLSSEVFSDVHLRAILQEVFMNLILPRDEWVNFLCKSAHRWQTLRQIIIAWVEVCTRHFNGVMPKRCKPIANELELHLFCINPHPVIRGLWGPGRHENCHYLKISLNLVMGFHVILKNVAGCHSWRFLYSVGELANNYFEFNENCT